MCFILTTRQLIPQPTDCARDRFTGISFIDLNKFVCSVAAARAIRTEWPVFSKTIQEATSEEVLQM